MEQYAIWGGSPLVGEVEIGGAKNAALPILAATVMTDESVIIDNLPDIKDINILLDTMQSIGVHIERINRHKVKINAANIHTTVVDGEAIRKMRASYYFVGAFLGKYKNADISLPGGCDIGSRAIDQHIKGFKALGANIRLEHGSLIAETDSLKGTHVFMDVVSVGATINIMMAAVFAEGTTVIENAAKEPHVVDLANFLSSMGANIKGAGTDVIRIKGVKSLHGSEYAVIPDQIEAGTFMAAAAITKGDITVKNIIPRHLECITAKLEEIGCEIHESDEAIRVVASKKLSGTQVKTMPYPGFPTDMQPQMAVTLGICEGNTSIVRESIFEDRFRYVEELAKMGCNITLESNVAVIEGVNKYTGANVAATDLRAGAALVLAALSADGFSTVDKIYYIERGYEDFPKKLRALGGVISKVESEDALKKAKLRVV